MSAISLRPVVLMSGITAAGPSAAVPLDYRFSGIQQRRLLCVVGAGDVVNVEVSADLGVNWSTHTKVTGPAQQIVVVDGPFTTLRANKVGAAGAADIRGVL